MKLVGEIYDHSCTKCDLSNTGNKYICLPGRGDPKSRALVVGEAPGATEDEQGEPFVGLSGGILNAALAKAGVGPNAVYVTNAVKCRPPKNRTPTTDELEACFGYLYEEVDLIQPVAIMPLGNPAMQAVLGDKGGITRKAGLWRKIEGTRDQDILVIPNLHPSYVNRYPEKQDFFEEVVDDFVKVWQYALNHSIEDSWRYARP